MRCPRCIKEDKKSIVTQGLSTTTAVFNPIRWDESGQMINSKNTNVSKTYYSCSEGHEWFE